MTFMSPQSKANREVALAAMRAKWLREKRTVKRRSGKQDELRCADLASACRVAERCVTSESLKAHLEIAASYFDEAEESITH